MECLAAYQRDDLGVAVAFGFLERGPDLGDLVAAVEVLVGQVAVLAPVVFGGLVVAEIGGFLLELLQPLDQWPDLTGVGA